MTLSVGVFTADENGKMLEVFDVPEGSSNLAGFESWRRTVWGSEAVRSLGAQFFPQLAKDDLYVYPDQVQGFIEECALLRSNLSLISRGSAASALDRELDQEEVVSWRLANIEDAAARALAVGAGVVIW